MDCVTECPDTAILGKVLSETELEEKLKTIPEADRAMYAAQWSKTKKYYDAGKKKQGVGGMFQIIIDPSKCKGCAECVTVCDDDALKMIAKTDDVMTTVAQEPPLLQEHRPVQRQVHQRQPAHRHDAQGADAHLRRRGRLLRRLRRGHGAADDVLPPPARSTATSGASSPRPAATRCTPRPIRTIRTWCRGPTRCSRTPRPTRSACGCAGTRWAGRTSRSGASAATGPCSTSASRRCRACWPAA